MQLTVDYLIGNGKRLVIAKVNPDEEQQTMTISWELRTGLGATPNDAVLASKVMVVRNGSSDRLNRQASPAAGSRINELLLLEPLALSTPTGFTDAMNAWRAAATTNARKAALEAHGLVVGWIHANLAGT